MVAGVSGAVAEVWGSEKARRFSALAIVGYVRNRALYVSGETHSSIDRAVRLLGVRLRRIPTDADLRLDVASLAAAVADDRAAGRRPWCVVATAGTTGTGSVDPLPELRRCCDEELLLLHLDGAYGAPAAICPEAKELLTSLEGADSRDGTIGDADIGANAISNDELAGGSVRSGEVLNGPLRDEDLQAGLLASDASVRFDNFAVPSGAQPVSEDVACPAGQRALGGGVSFGIDACDRVVFSKPRVGGAAPNAQGAVANGWGAAVLNGAGEQRTATVWVVCTAR
jgi:hypothetical protein